MLKGERPLSRVEGALMLLAGIMLFLMMANITADVAFKYLFNQPIAGTLELVANYYMVAAVFLPLAYVQSQQGHIRVEIFSQLMSERGTARVDVFAGFVSLIYIGFLAWTALEHAIHQTIVGEDWEILGWNMPIWPARWLVSLGIVVFIVRLLYDTRHNLDAARNAHVSIL